MKSVLLLFAVVGLCVCAAHAATPAPTWAAPQNVKAVAVSSPAVAQTTPPTVAGVAADTTSTAVSKAAAQISSPTTSPTVRTTTPRPSTTTATPSTKASTVTSIPTTGPILTAPSPTDSPIATLLTPLPDATTYEVSPPTESRTPDIDPGMTPYSGPTEMVTAEPTPTWEGPVEIGTATPMDSETPMPFFTPEVVQSPGFELPPGAYGGEQLQTPTETPAPFVGAEPQDAGGSSFLPRWLSYLLFIVLGISGVAGLALIGSYVGSRRPEEPSVGAAVPSGPAPIRTREPRLLQPGAPEPTIEQQILIDRIVGFQPQSMHIERLGQNLLRLERAAQVGAQDRSIRLGRLLILGAIPSAPVPATATAWARAHGFRILSADGSGMALLMPSLSTGGRSVLGVLPVGAMVEGASPIPMPVLFAERDRRVPSRPVSPAVAGSL